MDELRVELSPRVLRRQLSTSIVMLGVMLLALLNSWQHLHRPAWVLVVTVTLGPSSLVFWALARRDATVLDPRGITTRRFSRTRSCSWSEVARITMVESRINGRPLLLAVERTDGHKLRLGAPFSGGIGRPDADFTASVEQIMAYWHAVTATTPPDEGAV